MIRAEAGAAPARSFTRNAWTHTHVAGSGRPQPAHKSQRAARSKAVASFHRARWEPTRRKKKKTRGHGGGDGRIWWLFQIVARALTRPQQIPTRRKRKRETDDDQARSRFLLAARRLLRRVSLPAVYHQTAAYLKDTLDWLHLWHDEDPSASRTPASPPAPALPAPSPPSRPRLFLRR